MKPLAFFIHFFAVRYAVQDSGAAFKNDYELYKMQ